MFREFVRVFSYDIFAKAIAGCSLFLIIRILSPSQYADYSFFWSMSFLSAGFFAASLNKTIVVGYEDLQLADRKGMLLVAQLMIVGLSSALILVLNSASAEFVLGGVTFALGVAGLDFSKALYQRSLNFKAFPLVEVFKNSVILVGLLLLLYKGIDGQRVLLLQGGLGAIAAVVVLTRIRPNFDGFRWRETFRLYKSICRSDYVYLYLYLGIIAVFIQTDVFMLRKLSTDLQLATYSSSYRYYALAVMALESVNNVQLPMLMSAESKGQVQAIFRSHKKMVMAYVPVCLAGAILSPFWIPLIDQGKYPDAPIVFGILSVSAIFSFGWSPLINVLFSEKRFKAICLFAIFGWLINVGLNRVLVPQLGAPGAAIATFSGFLFINGSVFWTAMKVLKGRMDRLAP
ncbi:MAG: hypothetical protein CL675_10610 [Bdellovibrionaceae bacterium]|nr:hypothetical protein [Pseudobdellovibrionaceae bacterium]